jgi:hypothetical protein
MTCLEPRRCIRMKSPSLSSRLQRLAAACRPSCNNYKPNIKQIKIINQ